MKRLIFVNFIIFIFSFGSIYAQTDLSQQFMIEGLKKYLNGDTDSAINLLNKSLEENPKNEKSKNALVNIYVFLGKKYFKEKIYKSSKYNFNKVLKLNKNNKDAKEYLAKLKKIEDKLGKLKNYKKKEDIGKEKSDIEKELDQKHETNKQYISPDKRENVGTTETKQQSQKIIIQMKNQGSSDQESLDEFLSALKDIKKKGLQENKQVLDKFQEIQKEKEKLQKEKFNVEKSKSSQSYLFIIIIILLGVAVVVTITFLILRFYRLRVRMAEHTYKFTAEREAKILEVMNNVVNIEKKDDALRLENKPDNTFLLSDKGDTETQANSNIINVPVDKIENQEKLELHEIYTLGEIEKGLLSDNIQKIAPCLTAYYFNNKEKMMENFIYLLGEYKNNPVNFIWLLEVFFAIKNVDIFSHIVSKLISFDKISGDVIDKFKSLFENFMSNSLLNEEEELITDSKKIVSGEKSENTEIDESIEESETVVSNDNNNQSDDNTLNDNSNN